MAAMSPRVWLAAGGLVALYVVLTWLQHVPAVMTRNDGAVYLLLSREIGRFSYAQSWLVGAPFHTLYPPGFPIWLAAVGAVFGERLEVFTAANTLLVAAALVMIFDVVRRKWSPGLGLLVLSVAVLNPSIQSAGARFLSEALYLNLSVFVLWVTAVKPSGTRWLVVAGAAAIAAALTRSVGITIVAALGIHWLMERRWWALAVFVAASGATVGSWLLWTFLTPNRFIGGNYVATLALEKTTAPMWGIWQRWIHHAIAYWTQQIPWQVPLGTVQGTLVDNLLSISLMTLLAVLGMVACWNRWRLLAWYLAAYAFMLLSWAWVDGRLLEPIQPLILTVLLLAVTVPLPRLGHLIPRIALAGLLIGMVGGLYQQALPQLKSRMACDRIVALDSPTCFTDDQLSLLAAARWVGQNIPDSEIILSPKDGVMAYYSRHLVLHPGYVQGEGQGEAGFMDAVTDLGVRFVMLDRIHPWSRQWIRQVLTASCRRLRVVRSFPPRSVLFEVLPAGAGPALGAPGTACNILQAIGEYSEPNAPTIW